MFEDDRERDSKDKIEDGALLNFTIDNLQNGDHHGCKLCGWIMDDECVIIEDAVHKGAHIANDGLREGMIQLALNFISFSPPSPAKTLRELLLRNVEKFQDCCLYLQIDREDTDLLQLRFFGLWNRTTKKLVYRNLNGFQIQCNAGKFGTRKNCTTSS
jgi:hypothetical protein